MPRKGTIYQIRNLINCKTYIGSTINIKNRWRHHKRGLNNNKHHNAHLQNSWNKYGENNFVIEIIDTNIDKKCLIKTEGMWIILLSSYEKQFGYNFSKHPDIPNRGISKSRELILKTALKIRRDSSEKEKGLPSKFKGEKSHLAKLTWKEVNQIRKEWNKNNRLTLKILAEKNNVSQTTIGRILKNKNWKTNKYIRPMKNRKKKSKQAIDKRRGSNSSTAKLTEDNVLEIRRLWTEQKLYQREIATKFNVSEVTISEIVHRRTWTHI